MNVLITGAGGFIGNQLARELFRRGQLRNAQGQSEPITQFVLADLAFSPAARAGFGDSVAFVERDLGPAASFAGLLPPSPLVVFHLAAMVSGDGERHFDACLQANLDGTRHLLEACRATGSSPRVIFASSLAVFGGEHMPPVVSDQTKGLPQTTYGMTKLIGELLINDYSRKGFIDGRAARLPTIFIRPGRPNAAASSFASSLFREPLAGAECRLPVARNIAVPLLGYRRVVENLIRLAECDAAALGSDRAVGLPSTRYLVSDMIATLERVAGRKGIALGPIIDQPDAVIRKIVSGWPVGTDDQRADSLGLKADDSLEQVIEDYCADFLAK